MKLLERIVKGVYGYIKELGISVVSVTTSAFTTIAHYLNTEVFKLDKIMGKMGVVPDKVPEWIEKDELSKSIYTILQSADPDNLYDVSDYHGKIPDVVHAIYKYILTKVIEEADGTPQGAVRASQAYLRTNLTLNWVAWWTGVASEVSSWGQVENVGRLVNSINWGLGFGWLSWIILGTPFQLGIAQPLKEYYTDKFKPNDLTKTDLLKIYTKRWWPEYIIDHELGHLGYRDRAVYMLKALSFKDLNESTIKNLYQSGFISEKDAVAKLKELGYSDTDAELVFNSWGIDAVKEPKTLTKSEILKLYKYRQIDKNTAIGYLTQLGYPKDVADMLLATVDMQSKTESKELTQSKLEQAFINGVISGQEYLNKLLDLGYSKESAQILLEIAKKKKEPRELQIRKTTITRAYSLGVISKDKATKLLSEVGYSKDQITLILSIVDAEKKPPVEKGTTLANLRWAYKVGIITREEFIARLKEMHYSEDAIKLEIAKAEFTPTTTESKLTPSQILKAWSKGLLTDNECAERLLAKGYTADDVSLLMALEKM